MVCELDAKTRTKRLFVLVGARVACVVGINGGAQQGKRQSVIRVEPWWQRRTSTSTIRYKYKEAVAVAVAQKNEYEYHMIQAAARHTRMCLTSL